MFAVRYVALVALSLWLGVLLLLAGGAGAAPAAMRSLQLAGYLCGAIVLIALFILKFVGPPPRAFKLRAALAFALLVLDIYVSETHARAAPFKVVNVALALVLLSWYARE